MIYEKEIELPRLNMEVQINNKIIVSLYMPGEFRSFLTPQRDTENPAKIIASANGRSVWESLLQLENRYYQEETLILPANPTITELDTYLASTSGRTAILFSHEFDPRKIRYGIQAQEIYRNRKTLDLNPSEILQTHFEVNIESAHLKLNDILENSE